MNERIFELAEQSRDLVQSKHYLSGDIYYPGPMVPGDINLEKFAELIVRECASKAWFVEQYGIGDGAPVSKQIKEHFGVKE